MHSAKTTGNGDRLFIAGLVLVMALMLWTLTEAHRRNIAAEHPRAVMRGIDPETLRQGWENGRLSDTPARFFKRLDADGGTP